MVFDSQGYSSKDATARGGTEMSGKRSLESMSRGVESRVYILRSFTGYTWRRAIRGWEEYTSLKHARYCIGWRRLWMRVLCSNLFVQHMCMALPGGLCATCDGLFPTEPPIRLLNYLNFDPATFRVFRGVL